MRNRADPPVAVASTGCPLSMYGGSRPGSTDFREQNEAHTERRPLSDLAISAPRGPHGF